jgi:hypothetical protein
MIEFQVMFFHVSLIVKQPKWGGDQDLNKRLENVMQRERTTWEEIDQGHIKAEMSLE